MNKNLRKNMMELVEFDLDRFIDPAELAEKYLDYDEEDSAEYIAEDIFEEIFDELRIFADNAEKRLTEIGADARWAKFPISRFSPCDAYRDAEAMLSKYADWCVSCDMDEDIAWERAYLAYTVHYLDDMEHAIYLEQKECEREIREHREADADWAELKDSLNRWING